MSGSWFGLSLNVREQAEIATPVLRTQALGHLHRLFLASPGLYAIAVPKGGLGLIVWSNDHGALERLHGKLVASMWMRDYAEVGAVSALPGDYDGSWYRHRRYRIPSLGSDRKTGAEHGALRARRMKAAVDKHLHYFVLSSRSTGQRFSLIVEAELADPSLRIVSPTSYGLAQGGGFSLPSWVPPLRAFSEVR